MEYNGYSEQGTLYRSEVGGKVNVCAHTYRHIHRQTPIWPFSWWVGHKKFPVIISLFWNCSIRTIVTWTKAILIRTSYFLLFLPCLPVYLSVCPSVCLHISELCRGTQNGIYVIASLSQNRKHLYKHHVSWNVHTQWKWCEILKQKQKKNKSRIPNLQLSADVSPKEHNHCLKHSESVNWENY